MFDRWALHLLCILLGILFATPAGATTPLIDSVKGTIATGQTLTITGTKMMDEDKTNWGTAYKSGTKYGFEGASYTADGYGEAPDANPQERAYDSSVFLMGAKSYRGRIYGTSSSCPSGNHSSGLYITLSEDGVGSSTDFYVRLYSRWNSNGSGSQWPASHIKMLDVQGTGDQMYFQPAASSNLPTQMTMVYDGANHYSSPAKFLEENRWYCMEARFKTSSPRNFTAWVDGVQVGNATPSSVGSYAYVLFNMINACEFTNLDLTNWTDGFTVSTSRIFPASMVEIANNSTYASATKVKQAPVYLSDTSIQVRADLTGLGQGPYYLFVTNNKQETSAAYPIGGTGGDVTPPTATITAPGAGALVSENVTLSASCSDDTACSGVQFKVDGIDVGSEDTSSPYSISWDSTSLLNGSHTITAVARDAIGNSATSFPVSVTVQNTVSEPIVTLLSEGLNDTNWQSKGWYDGVEVSPHLHGVIDTSVKYAGNSSLRYDWAQGATQPTNGRTTRHTFTATDTLYISTYIRLGAGWIGSGKTYHPHLLCILSDLDGDYDGLAYNYLDTYIEVNGTNPRFLLQDGRNIALPHSDLTQATENRAVAGCNGCLGDCGTAGQSCYDSGDGTYWNGETWQPTTNLSTGVWHRYEGYFKMNSISGGKAQADGVMKMWVDGSLVINKSNIVYRTNKHPTMKWHQIALAPWIGDGSPKAQSMWLDELMIGINEPYPTTPTRLRIQ